MAEKETKPTKSAEAKTTVKATAKPAATAPKTTATAKPAATTASKTPAPKTTATVKTTATAKPAATTEAKPSAAKTTATPKSEATTAKTTATATAKPAAPKTTVTAAAKPATTAKPADAKVKTAAAETAAASATATKTTVAASSVAPVGSEKTEKAQKVKKEKPAKAAKTSTGSGSAAKAKVAAIVKTDNFKIFSIIGLSLIMVLCLCLGLIFGLRSCTGMSWVLGQDPITVNAYAQTTMVGYSAKTVGEFDRYKPVTEMKDEREMFSLGDTIEANIANGTTELARLRYPKYGSTMNSVVGSDPDGLKADARTALINESDYLTAYGTYNNSGNGQNGVGTYNMMDKDGYLYFVNNGEVTPATYEDGTQRQLYKHTASVGMYLGDVSDDEKGIIKKVTLRPRGYSSYSVTGVYACAGEVIKIELSDADMTATGGITIHIGQALYNGQSNNIWTAKGQMQRFPNILNTMVVNKNTAVFNEESQMWTAYVGSFIGGPLYIRNTSSAVSVTISGGVAYRHFILGYTTPDEFEQLSKSSVPYFDLEVWDRGVLHSGPLTYAKAFSYDDLYKAAVLWEKVSIVANANGIGTNCYNQGIVFLYDPFVAAGAAVAFPGRSSVNCPMGWMSSSLNYTSTVTSGSWGNFHEYHHNFQNYGVGYTGEVTNNGLNLVAYSLFTNISSARQMGSYGGAGLSGWNCYTSATWAQQMVKSNNINSTSGLAVYSTLLHNFGQEAFLNARGSTGVNYWNRYAQVTHYDFSYFDQNTTVYSGGPLNPAETEYPLFVPVSSVYQTGRTYLYDGEKRESTTMQPYVIPYGVPFTVDLRPYTMIEGTTQYNYGSVLIGASTSNDFTYKIKGVKTDGINGTFVKAGEDGVYTFTPNSELRSGKIYVTLEIYNAADGTREWNGHKLDDVDLILEFQQSHEWNKNVLERTTYYYTADTKYTDAREAFENGYAGYESKVDRDHSNPTQNANTDIWYCTDYTISRFPNANPETDIVNENSIDELRGKLYINQDGWYRIYLRGRRNCALYYSLDGGATYQLGTYINNDTNDSSEFVGDKYFDLKLKAGSWVYIKEVLINMKIDNNRTSYIGVGTAQWTELTATTDEDGTIHYWYGNREITMTTDEDGTVHYWYRDSELTAKTDEDGTYFAPTSATYATAYRQDYEFQKEFESEYFFTRPINYSYNDRVVYSGRPTLVSVSHNSWDSTRLIDYLLDGNVNTTYHSAGGNANFITETKPFELVVDLGETFKANHVTFYGYHYDGDFKNNGMPVTFTLYGSLDGEEFFEILSRENMTYDAFNLTFDFDAVELRYYKLYVTHTDNGKYFAMNEIQFYYEDVVLTGNGNNFFSPDNAMFTYKGNWKVESCSAHFGHVYVGKEATMEFEFEGSRLAILASKYYGQNYEVRIDGQMVESIAVKEDSGDYSVVFLTPELSEGKHSVVIYCRNEGNIDAIAFW
ncbi:MAG: M60 family metallopeptidase [Clostridia bacterium]|nr:M60 family metallopeptidase [Clostridia bacterium]